ncbi:MAG: hypothetical protein K6E33_08780, partial [Lachnospiraceae bacterium]|nr:hypothetical protein [Lachnospiraceae bacterium]
MSHIIPYIFILCDTKTDPMMETLNYFQKQMSQAVSDPVFITFSPGNAFIDAVNAIDHRIGSDTTVVMFNNRGFTASIDGKTLYWAEKNVRLVNILVDHPFYYTDMLLMAPPNMKLGLVDRHFVSLMNKWLPSIGKNAFFLPHGGVDLGLSRVPFSKRPVDVLYIGSRYSDDVFYPPLEHLPGNGSEFYEFAADMYFDDDYIEEDGIVERYLEVASIEATIPQKI